MKIMITCDIPDEYVDAEHESGVTEEGHRVLLGRLIALGCDDIELTRAEAEAAQ